MIRIVQFSNGNWAVRLGIWPFHSFADKHDQLHRWRSAHCVRRWAMVDTLPEAQEMANKLKKPPRPKVVKVLKT